MLGWQIATRIDLAQSRVEFAKLQQKCPESCFRYMVQSLAYLNHTKNMGIAYYKNTTRPNEIVVFVDTGFATCKVTRRSTCMVIIFLNGGPIDWKSFRLTRAYGSTMETETDGVYYGATTAKYFRHLLEE